MKHATPFRLKPIAFALAVLPAQLVHAQISPTTSPETVQSAPGHTEGSRAEAVLSEIKVTATAQEHLKQAPGVSIISAEDIEKRPPANDLSEIIRRMPGVNLTGNSSSGVRGNNRQIDLRGMGPENTLILIDGKPVTSRNSVRYGKSGERDTRGDSNWVPAEAVESIEVIRGPAAARYGSGAAGGVVNIITKGITKETAGTATVYVSQPQHEEEGGSSRANFNLSGPMAEDWGFRLYGNYNKTDADSPDINAANTAPSASTAAGREGVINEDFNSLIRWKPAPGQSLDLSLGYSHQGNIYAGDTQTGASGSSSTAATGSNPSSFLGQETNSMTRNSYSLEHKGDWSIGKSKSYFQYEKTDNERLDEGLVGGSEGNINSNVRHTSQLDGYTFHSELNSPLKSALPQMLTTGVEWNFQKLDDPASILNAWSTSGIPSQASKITTSNEATMLSAFMEDNIELNTDLILTPGLRLDNHSEFGNNWSPSLNASYQFTPAFTLKGGIARAFKAPNLYQSHPSYLQYSSGNGCNKTTTYTTRCYLLGNEDLDPEVSINKEIGINWTDSGWNAGLTWFRNDYSSKIVASSELVGIVSVSGQDRYVYRWENATDAVVEGLEGNLLVPLTQRLNWINNFTYMLRNDDQKGEPLSIIPEYTVNTTLDWQASDKLSLALTGTFYGKQVPRTTAYNTALENVLDATNTVDPYNLWGISAGYTFSSHWKGRVGVNNLFDKRLFREGNSSGAGAATYNEPGRAFYASLTTSF